MENLQNQTFKCGIWVALMVSCLIGFTTPHLSHAFYEDSRDTVFAGRASNGDSAYKQYLADMRYLDAAIVADEASRKYVQLLIALTAQNPMAEAMPKISVFIDADRNPATGSILAGTNGGAEYRVDFQLMMSSVLDATKMVSVWVWQFPKTSEEAEQFLQENLMRGRETWLRLLMTGTVSAASGNGLDVINLTFPAELFGNATDVNLCAYSYLPHISAVNPFQRPDLPNRQGDRAPDFGQFNTRLRRVVNDGPASTAVTFSDKAFDNQLPTGNPAGPDIREVRFQTIGDQFYIRMTFQDDILQSMWAPNTGFRICFDSDRSLATGQIMMGNDIPTWGGDIGIGWVIGPVGVQAFSLFVDNSSTQGLTFGGGTDSNNGALNDGRWNIAGNVVELWFSKSLLDAREYFVTKAARPSNEMDFVRVPAVDDMLLNIQMIVQNPVQYNDFTDWMPAKNWVLDLGSGKPLPPLVFDRDRMRHSTESAEMMNPALDIQSIDYQLEPDYLIIRATIANWIPDDWQILFECHLDTDGNANTGYTSTIDEYRSIRGADYILQVDSYDDYTRTNFRLSVSDFSRWKNGESPSEAPYDAWLKVVPPAQFGLPGTITITIPRDEIALTGDRTKAVFRTGKFMLNGKYVGVPVNTYYDYFPNNGFIEMGFD